LKRRQVKNRRDTASVEGWDGWFVVRRPVLAKVNAICVGNTERDRSKAPPFQRSARVKQGRIWLDASNRVPVGPNGQQRKNRTLILKGEPIMQTGEKQTIAGRAYHIWEREGRPHGQDLDHWLQAEREIEAEGRSAAPAGRTTRKPAKTARVKKTTPKTSRKAPTSR
jgi:hypothetical protein